MSVWNLLKFYDKNQWQSAKHNQCSMIDTTDLYRHLDIWSDKTDCLIASFNDETDIIKLKIPLPLGENKYLRIKSHKS